MPSSKVLDHPALKDFSALIVVALLQCTNPFILETVGSSDALIQAVIWTPSKYSRSGFLLWFGCLDDDLNYLVCELDFIHGT